MRNAHKKKGINYRLFEESVRGIIHRAQAEGETLGKIKLLLSHKGKLLGCQIILGFHAGILIHEWVIAAAGNVKLSTMAGAVHTDRHLLPKHLRCRR